MVLREDDPDIALFSVLGADGATDPSRDPRPPDDLLVRGYREMVRLRLLGARLAMLHKQGRVGAMPSGGGAEAVPVATALVLREGDEADWVFPARGEHGLLLARGFPLRAFVGQAFGNASDPAKGRREPGLASARSAHHASGSSRAGSQLPQAVGAAWAMRARGVRSAAVAFLDERTTSQGDFHAALNLAGVWRAPCVFVASSAKGDRQSASRTLAVKARAYGIHGVRVDGGDFLALLAVMGSALARARAGEGPTLVEAAGEGPSASSPTASASDPIERLRRHLERRGLVTAATEEALRRDLAAEIAAAIDDVERLGPPERATLFTDVYAEPPWHLREQAGSLKNVAPPPT